MAASAADEVLLPDGELLLDAPPFDVLDPLGRVVDGVHDGVGEPALAVLKAHERAVLSMVRSILIVGGDLSGQQGMPGPGGCARRSPRV